MRLWAPLKTAFILKISIKESGFYLCIVPTREHPLKQFLEVPLFSEIIHISCLLNNCEIQYE